MRDAGGKISPRLTAAVILLSFSCVLIAGGLVLVTRGGEPEPTEPAPCVTMLAYSYAIEDVMGVYPQWSPLRATGNGFVSTWAIEGGSASHLLSATLTRDECICATLATSSYPNGSPESEFAGMLQGAAIAPLSDLKYADTWLMPRVLLSCGPAYFRREISVSAEIMPDGTSWKLECGRRTAPAYAPLELSFSVSTQQCLEPSP